MASSRLLFLLYAIVASALAISLAFLLEVPGQASDVCARRVRVRDRSLVGFVGVEGLIGDVGVGVTIGHISDVGLDRPNNTKRTIRQNAVMGAAAAGRRRSGSTSERAAKTGGGSSKPWPSPNRAHERWRNGGAARHGMQSQLQRGLWEYQAPRLSKRAVANRSRIIVICYRGESRSSTVSREKHGVDEVVSRGSASLISESNPASACEPSSPSLSGVASPDGGSNAADRADADALPGPLYFRRPDFGGICQEQV